MADLCESEDLKRSTSSIVASFALDTQLKQSIYDVFIETLEIYFAFAKIFIDKAIFQV